MLAKTTSLLIPLVDMLPGPKPINPLLTVPARFGTPPPAEVVGEYEMRGDGDPEYGSVPP